MANRSKPPNGGLTPGKSIAIGILAVVLLVIVVTQFGGKKNGGVPESSGRRPAARRSEPTSTAAPAPSIAVHRTERPWPTFDVAAVIASNPFALLEVLLGSGEAAKPLTATAETGEVEVNVAAIASADVREMRRRQAEFLTSLRAQGVDMILRSPRGSLARIGDLSLRVGDVHEGLRVEEIGQNGVVFAPIEAGEMQIE